MLGCSKIEGFLGLGSEFVVRCSKIGVFLGFGLKARQKKAFSLFVVRCSKIEISILLHLSVWFLVFCGGCSKMEMIFGANYFFEIGAVLVFLFLL